MAEEEPEELEPEVDFVDIDSCRTCRLVPETRIRRRLQLLRELGVLPKPPACR